MKNNQPQKPKGKVRLEGFFSMIILALLIEGILLLSPVARYVVYGCLSILGLFTSNAYAMLTNEAIKQQEKSRLLMNELEAEQAKFNRTWLKKSRTRINNGTTRPGVGAK